VKQRIKSFLFSEESFFMKHETKNLFLRNRYLGKPARWIYSRPSLWRNLGYDKRQAEEYDRQTKAVMERVLLANSNCVDVGCHKGEVLREMLKLAPEGTHYAFEPIPYLYRALVKSFQNVFVHQIALSDKPGVTTFHHVLDRPAYSGIRQRMYPSGDEIVEQIEVRQDTLDNVITKEVSVDFIKIDVEGAELGVLKGAARTIRDNKPVIVFEHSLGAADHYGTRPDEVYEFLTGPCGLSVSLMERWLRDEGPLSQEEFVKEFERNANYYFMAHALG